MSDDTVDDTANKTEEDTAKKEGNSWVDRLQKTGRVLATVAGLCYLAGFLITNIYLASLGVVAFDILKAKYILSGFAFLSFTGILLTSLYGLWRILRQYPKQVFASVLFEALLYSTGVYGLLYLFLAMLTLLDVDPATSHSLVSVTQTTLALNRPEFLYWLGTLGLIIIGLLLMVGITYIAAIALATALSIVVNSALGIIYIFETIKSRWVYRNKVVEERSDASLAHRHMRWWNPYGTKGAFWQDRKQQAKFALLHFSFIAVLVILFNGLVSIIERNFIIVTAPEIKLSPGWASLFQAVLLIYGSITLLFLLSFRLWSADAESIAVTPASPLDLDVDKVSKNAGSTSLDLEGSLRSRQDSLLVASDSDTEQGGTAGWGAQYAGWAILSILIFVVSVPVYALGIYDQLPQEFGGGEPIPVAQVATSKPETSYKSEGNTKVSLIDRTSDGSIFLRVEFTQTINIVEITSSELEAITFISRPK